MKKESNSLIDVLNNIVKGYKDIKLEDGCIEPSKVTVAYRSIFGNEYKDINTEIIAEQLSEEKEGESEKEGKWKAFYNFLKGRDGLWMDLIGCDSFSDKIKKQIFFATISMDAKVAKERELLLDAYKKLIKSIPLDLFIQLFFIDRERFLNGLKIKESIDKVKIKSFEDRLVKIQSNGFVLSFSSKQDNESLVQNNDDYPLILNVSVRSFNDFNDFKKEIKNIDVQKISFPLEVKKLLESFDYKPKPETATLSDLSTLIARFNQSLHSEIKFLYFVPIHCPDGSVGLFCYGSKADKLLDSNTIDELRLLSYNLLYPYVSSYKSAWDSKQVIKESIKSAIAAIMSRNMSHNLGSHVMAYLKNDLRNVPAIFASSVLHQLFPDHIKGEALKVSGEVELPFLVGLGNFIGYLQERQDYIATIASSYIPSFSPVNFKDSIYDELNPDLRFERHHGNDPNNHNRPQNILLSYIAKSEKLSRLNTDNVHNHDILLGFKHNGETFWGLNSPKNNSEKESDSLTHMRLVNFALPGGVVGRQAIFSIVENIIRNAAKHNNVQGNLELTFEVIDGEELKANPDAFESRISSEYIRSLYKDSVDIENLIILTITDNQECHNSTIDKLRTALRQPYIGENAESNKGVKEIRISATWLRGEDDDTQFAPCPMDDNEQIISNQKAPTVVIEKSKEGHLRYSLCLRKTYEFALVYDEKKKDDIKFENRFQLKDGSYKSIPASVIVSSDICFEYIIAENSSVFNEIRPYVTNRCVNVEDIVTDESIKITPGMIYEAYTGINDESPCIVIDDDKVEGILFKDKIKKEVPTQENRLFLYRSHHFSEKDFGAYWLDRANGKYPDNIACIDGITGDNSSDRLVRREKLNKKWYIGHLYAMQSRVAVFDERLFQIVHGLDESQMTLGSYTASKLSNLCKEGKWPDIQLTELELEKLAIKELYIQYDSPDIDTFIELYNVCIEAPDRKDGDNGLSNREKMIHFLEPYCFKFKEHVEGHQHLTAAYAEKGVDVYTIIPLGNRECLIVGSSSYNYKYESSIETGEKPVYNFNFEPIAHIWRDEKKDFRIDILNNYSLKEFKYLSIHQGLIDKMYTEFGIEDKDEDIKKDLMHTLYNSIMVGMDIGNPDSFMPRLTIHSGRGHITRKDMPNNQPFLQYSAIEHAVLDCKYALVELLDFAKFKKS